MKHLKTIRIFEAISEEVEDIKDICLELEDKGYTIYHRINNNRNSFTIRRDDMNTSSAYERSRLIQAVYFPYAYFLYSDVSEVVERLSDYLGDKVLQILVEVVPVDLSVIPHQTNGINGWVHFNSDELKKLMRNPRLKSRGVSIQLK